ncbi:MAG: hypothetical protein J5I98_18080 [Phaeodactylibacter sp.]|nr:hypothetical protein [Phaeodactylibacter sp.]
MSSVIFGCLFLSGCIVSEISSEPEPVHIKILHPEIEKIDVLFRHRRFYFSFSSQNGKFSYIVPAMDGGFTNFLGIKFNVHDPYEYENIIVQYEGQELKKLSLNDVYALDSYQLDSLNIYILDLQ